MKRKTNLFYVNGPDSKFLTFSNYTESLTGNFLSTDTKLFPDKFLCLKINNLNSINKSEFIKYLVRYYENKLASLRDDCINNDEVSEKYMLPLAYLLEAILRICEFDNNEKKFTIDNNRFRLQQTYLNVNEYPLEGLEGLITYIGSITEQDYNGTYTDTICNINANEYYEGVIKLHTNTNNYTRYYTNDNYPSILYGWEDSKMFEEYDQCTPIYDNESTYYYDTLLDNIEYVKQPKNNVYKTIEFNVIIPLFSVTNMNYNTNTTILEEEVRDFNEEENGNGNKCIILDSNTIETNNLKAIRDVPLGMWIYADDTSDTFIQLKHDNSLNMYPSWSLLIGSQFKPFPYSLKYEKENGINNSSGHAYATFAETLSKINDVLESFNNINTNINKLNTRIDSLERQIREIGTRTNITQMEKRFLELNNQVKNELNDFKKQLHGYVDNITWSSKYKNNN